MKKKITESQLRNMIKKSLMEEIDRYEMGRGAIGVDASFDRIGNALESMKRIADTMSKNGYYETEESSLRSSINYIEQEINYIKKNI